MQLIAYKCLECGHFTISRCDGIKCAKCGGYATPVGHATNREKNKCMDITVNVKDIDVFKCSIAILKELLEREDTPKDIIEKVNIFIKEHCKAE